MRIFALGLGGLLLLGGGVLVVLADQDRQAAVEITRQNIVELEHRVEGARAVNLSVAEALTSLRSAIAEQEKQLAETKGFLE